MTDGRQCSVQNMINAVIFMALFDGKDIFRFRDDTDRAVISVVIVTDAADITFRQVLAYLAAMDIFSGLDDCIGKSLVSAMLFMWRSVLESR